MTIKGILCVKEMKSYIEAVIIDEILCDDFLRLFVMIIISLVIYLLRAFIPTTTAVIALFAPMLISVSQTTGLSISALLMTASFWAASALLLIYTEPIYLISYKEGYFRELDLLKTGIIPSLALSAAATFVIYYLTCLVGI